MTIFIKNAKIFGSIKNLEKADILISGDKISAIGNFYNKKADKIIDAGGSYVSPGFIDVYNQLDHNFSLLKKENQERILNQGITTVIIGHNGFSLAPILYPKPYALDYYTNVYNLNSNWKTVKDFYNFLNKNFNGLNIKTFVGFDTLKYIICPHKNSEMTKNEFSIFNKLLLDALKEGALGLSLDWDDVLMGFTSLKQIEEIAKILENKKAILSISLPYLKDMEDSIDDIVEIVLKTKIKVLLNDYLNDYLTPEQNIKLLKKIYKAYPNIFLSIPPYYSETVLFYKLLPFWFKKNTTAIYEGLNDEWLQKRIIENLPDFDPLKFKIIETENGKRYKELNGKTLKEIMDIYEFKDVRKSLFHIIKILKLHGLGEYEKINPDVFLDNLISLTSLISSGGFSFNENTAIFSDFFSLVLKNKLIPQEKIFSKVFIEPANFFGFDFIIKEGNFSNLIGFDLKNNKIEIKFVISKNKVILNQG
jgi:hypothetical protein